MKLTILIIALTVILLYKFRHGHIHYGLANAKTIAQFKAVSENAIHSSMKITDQFYSGLKSSELKDQIASIGKNKALGRGSSQEKIQRIRELLGELGIEI